MDGTCQIDYNLYIRNPGVESYRLVYIWVQSEGGRAGRGGAHRVFWTPPPKIYGHSYEILNTSSESPAQARSIGTLFEQFGLKGGSVDMSKSQRHTRSGAGRGVSQANEATIYPKLTGLCQLEIVSGNLKKWKHISDSASQLWVPGTSREHGRPYINFPPITMQRFNFRS